MINSLPNFPGQCVSLILASQYSTEKQKVREACLQEVSRATCKGKLVDQYRCKRPKIPEKHDTSVAIISGVTSLLVASMSREMAARHTKRLSLHRLYPLRRSDAYAIAGRQSRNGFVRSRLSGCRAAIFRSDEDKGKYYFS